MSYLAYISKLSFFGPFFFRSHFEKLELRKNSVFVSFALLCAFDEL